MSIPRSNTFRRKTDIKSTFLKRVLCLGCWNTSTNPSRKPISMRKSHESAGEARITWHSESPSVEITKRHRNTPSRSIQNLRIRILVGLPPANSKSARRFRKVAGPRFALPQNRSGVAFITGLGDFSEHVIISRQKKKKKACAPQPVPGKEFKSVVHASAFHRLQRPWARHLRAGAGSDRGAQKWRAIGFSKADFRRETVVNVVPGLPERFKRNARRSNAGVREEFRCAV